MWVKADSVSFLGSLVSGGEGKIISVLFLVVSNPFSGSSSSGVYPLNTFSKWMAPSFVQGKLRTM